MPKRDDPPNALMGLVGRIYDEHMADGRSSLDTIRRAVVEAIPGTDGLNEIITAFAIDLAVTRVDTSRTRPSHQPPFDSPDFKDSVLALGNNERVTFKAASEPDYDRWWDIEERQHRAQLRAHVVKGDNRDAMKAKWVEMPDALAGDVWDALH